jgi:hypothetical protein
MKESTYRSFKWGYLRSDYKKWLVGEEVVSEEGISGEANDKRMYCGKVRQSQVRIAIKCSKGQFTVWLVQKKEFRRID